MLTDAEAAAAEMASRGEAELAQLAAALRARAGIIGTDAALAEAASVITRVPTWSARVAVAALRIAAFTPARQP